MVIESSHDVGVAIDAWLEGRSRGAGEIAGLICVSTYDDPFVQWPALLDELRRALAEPNSTRRWGAAWTMHTWFWNTSTTGLPGALVWDLMMVASQVRFDEDIVWWTSGCVTDANIDETVALEIGSIAEWEQC